MKAIHLCGIAAVAAVVVAPIPFGRLQHVPPAVRPPPLFKEAAERKFAVSSNGVGTAQTDRSESAIAEMGSLSQAARRFAEKEPREGVRYAASIRDPEERRSFLNALFRYWGELHGPSALDFVMKLTGELHGVRPRELLAAAAYGWSGQSPAIAANWMAEHLTMFSPAHRADVVLAGIVWLWAGKDLPSSMEWVASRADLPNQQDLYRSVGFAWAGLDLAGALARASEAPEASVERLGLLSGALRKWSEDSPREASRWMSGKLNSGELVALRDTVRIAAVHLSGHDRSAALDWGASMPERSLRTEVLADVANPWIHDAPGDAMAALQKAPLPVEERLDVVGTTVKHWSHLDPSAASDWIEQQPAGMEKDRAISEFVETVASEEPAAAATWAASIGDVARRDDALLVVTREWMRVEPGQCVAWFDANQKRLGPELVATVHRLVSQR